MLLCHRMKYFWFAMIGILVGAVGVILVSNPQLLNASLFMGICQKFFASLPLPSSTPLILGITALVLILCLVGAVIALGIWAKKFQKINKAQEESIYELHSQIAELLKIREPKRPL